MSYAQTEAAAHPAPRSKGKIRSALITVLLLLLLSNRTIPLQGVRFAQPRAAQTIFFCGFAYGEQMAAENSSRLRAPPAAVPLHCFT